MPQIKITTSTVQLIAELNDCATTRALLDVLPCQSTSNTWGDEVYFRVPLSVKLETDARQVVEAGTVCFWVEGNSLALPYGPTPISEGDECRLISKVNVIGLIQGNPLQLADIHANDSIRIELA